MQLLLCGIVKKWGCKELHKKVQTHRLKICEHHCVPRRVDYRKSLKEHIMMNLHMEQGLVRRETVKRMFETKKRSCGFYERRVKTK